MNPEILTIKQARDIMRPLLETGTICPCCSQSVKLYRRPLSSAMALGILLLFNETQKLPLQNEAWIHLESFFKEQDCDQSIRGDCPKLRFWGLLQPKEGEKTDGNPNNGYYKLTDAGKLFAQDKLKVSSHVRIYNNTFYGFPTDSKEIGIQEALKNKFNYSEIIQPCHH